MSERARFINDPQTFNRYWQLVQHTVDSNRRLPEQVFHEEYSGFMFCDFNRAMDPEFWPRLQLWPFTRSDDTVLTMVLDPDPVSGFGQPTGTYAAFTLPVVAGSEAYHQANWTVIGTDVVDLPPRQQPVPEGRRGSDNIEILAETVVWVPESLEWAMWGERSNALAILALNATNRLNHPIVDDFWGDIEDALGMVYLTCGGKEVPAKWEAEFRANYFLP